MSVYILCLKIKEQCSYSHHRKCGSVFFFFWVLVWQQLGLCIRNPNQFVVRFLLFLKCLYFACCLKLPKLNVQQSSESMTGSVRQACAAKVAASLAPWAIEIFVLDGAAGRCRSSVLYLTMFSRRMMVSWWFHDDESPIVVVNFGESDDKLVDRFRAYGISRYAVNCDPLGVRIGWREHVAHLAKCLAKNLEAPIFASYCVFHVRGQFEPSNDI